VRGFLLLLLVIPCFISKELNCIFLSRAGFWLVVCVECFSTLTQPIKSHKSAKYAQTITKVHNLTIFASRSQTDAGRPYLTLTRRSLSTPKRGQIRWPDQREQANATATHPVDTPTLAAHAPHAPRRREQKIRAQDRSYASLCSCARTRSRRPRGDRAKKNRCKTSHKPTKHTRDVRKRYHEHNT